MQSMEPHSCSSWEITHVRKPIGVNYLFFVWILQTHSLNITYGPIVYLFANIPMFHNNTLQCAVTHHTHPYTHTLQKWYIMLQSNNPWAVQGQLGKVIPRCLHPILDHLLSIHNHSFVIVTAILPGWSHICNMFKIFLQKVNNKFILRL